MNTVVKAGRYWLEPDNLLHLINFFSRLTYNVLTMTIVSYQNCLEELVCHASPLGQQELTSWERRNGYEDVVRFVKGFSHSYLYSITSKEIKEVIRATDPPLGTVKATESIALIENYTAPFAFQHLFHWYLEQYRKVPTWQEFRDWMIKGDAAPYWYERLKRFLEIRGRNYTKQQWSHAAKWRLGKSYISSIRELDLLVRVREAGLPLRYHVLADVLFRTDFWYQNVLICVYFSNSFYRDGFNGRKIHPRDYFPPEGHFAIRDVKITRQGFGKIWLAKPAEIEKVIMEVTNNLR